MENKSKISKTLLFICLISFFFKAPLQSCTIFLANDGQNVWAGNNEDELNNTKYRMWFYPAKNNHHGYVIWTDLNIKLMSKIELKFLAYLNPQGGLNEHGLFIDYTAIDAIPLVKDVNKKDRKKEIATDLLKNCKTVEEALTYISQFNLIGIHSAQMFIADASGDYATVTGGYVVRKTENSFAITNYPINTTQRKACHRRDITTQLLNEAKTFELSDIANILEKSSQKYPYKYTTNVSTAANLKSKTLNLYYKHDFKTVVTLSLIDELKKGKHHRDVETYFPKNISPLLEKTYLNKGVDACIAQYETLRLTSPTKYNFNSQDALNLAIKWLNAEANNDALKFLTCLYEYDKENLELQSWIGVANRKMNNIEESNRWFENVLRQNPDDYLATLWGKQEAGKVTFKLRDFENSERVWVVGEFTDGLKNPIKLRKENGYWTGQANMPKGETTYRFVVNNSYYNDFKNTLHEGTNENTLSKIYVW